MLNMESPQMYDTVQTMSQLDLKKQQQPQQQQQQASIIGQITLTAMGNANGNLLNGNSVGQDNNNNSNNNNHNGNGGGGGANGTGVTNGGVNQNNGLVIKQHALHHMQQQAAAMNNNNSALTNNNNNNNNNNNVNSVANNLLQKQMLQQYTQNELDELTAQEITLDLQHLIDDQFREQEALGIFSDMVSSPGGLGSTLQTNGVVSAAAKVLQQHQQLQQQNLRTQNHGYGRSALAYMPQAVHSGAAYNNNTNSSDENSSVGSDTSTIKEEPIDPDYRRHLQDATNSGNAAAFIGAAAAVANGTANGLYNPYQAAAAATANGGSGLPGAGSFTNLTPTNALHHPSLPHLTGAHLASLKHHNKQMQHVSQRKQSLKHIDKGTDEYRRRRERNNIAVRKSREKAKVRSREVEERVKTLLKEKDVLMRRVEEMSNEITVHKQVYMQLMNHANPEVVRICRSFLNMNDHSI